MNSLLTQWQVIDEVFMTLSEYTEYMLAIALTIVVFYLIAVVIKAIF
jgi:hypothetical protein